MPPRIRTDIHIAPLVPAHRDDVEALESDVLGRSLLKAVSKQPPEAFKGLVALSHINHRNDAKTPQASPPSPALVGTLWWQQVLGEADILSFVVAKSHQRKGVGTLLWTDMLKKLRRADIRCVHLEVRVSNTPARIFYERMGAKQISTRTDYYTNNDGTREDALVFQVSL